MRLPHPKSSLEHQAPHAAQRHEGAIRVRATKRGFYDNHLKEVGDEFTIPDGEKLGSWMALVTDDRAPDQDAAMEKAFVEAKLPEEDRRGVKGKKGSRSDNDVL